MTILRHALPTVALMATAIAATTAVGASTMHIDEHAPTVPVAGGLFMPAQASDTWFGGMYSPAGKGRGFAMGYNQYPTGTTGHDVDSTMVLAFGSGPRVVTRHPGPASVAKGFTRRILGGTGAYLGMRGTEQWARKGANYDHTLTYTLPAKGAAKVHETYTVRYGAPIIIERGGANGAGDARNISGGITNPAGQSDGQYDVDSVQVFTYSGGLYSWFIGDGTYTFGDGSTLHAVGPYQRANGSAPGVLAASPRVIDRGTGRYAGMRGQVVVSSNADGTSSHAFTLLKK